MRSIARLALLIVMWTCGPEAALATWRLDMEGGAFFPVSDVEGPQGNFSADFDPGFTLGVGGGYAPLHWLEILSHMQGGYSDAGDAFADTLSFTSWTFGARVLPFPWYWVNPWGIFELGWYHVDADIDDDFFGHHDSDADDDSFGINVGGGIDFRITDFVSIGPDVRYHNAFDAFDGVDFVTAVVNVSLHFGRR